MNSCSTYTICYLHVQDACKVSTYAVLRHFNMLGINDDDIQVAKVIGSDHMHKNDSALCVSGENV